MGFIFLTSVVGLEVPLASQYSSDMYVYAYSTEVVGLIIIPEDWQKELVLR